MKTKKGFGGLLNGGLDCEVMGTTIGNDGKTHCAIRLLNNGMIYWGCLSDLMDIKKENIKTLICLASNKEYKNEEASNV